VHVADTHVAIRQPVLGDGDQPLGGIDAGHGCTTQGGQLQGETGAAREIEHPVAVADTSRWCIAT